MVKKGKDGPGDIPMSRHNKAPGKPPYGLHFSTIYYTEYVDRPWYRLHFSAVSWVLWAIFLASAIFSVMFPDFTSL